ncbi:MAG: hypothetical protein Q4E45_08770 [Eubacteriales bacterium]|nr:hypothetical protein [Eubacteriales bacterium]
METKVKNREWVKDAAIVFLAVLLVLTFFSNTIMNRTLPEVATAAVHEGAIVAKVRGTGTVTATGKHQVKAKETRTIRSVMVKIGQEVKAGDVLFVLGEGDETELEQAKERLRNLQTSYEKTALSTPIYDYSSYNRAIESAENAYNRAWNEYAEAQNKVDSLETDPIVKAARQRYEDAEAKLKTEEDKYNEGRQPLAEDVDIKQTEYDIAAAAEETAQSVMDAIKAIGYPGDPAYDAAEAALNELIAEGKGPGDPDYDAAQAALDAVIATRKGPGDPDYDAAQAALDAATAEKDAKRDALLTAQEVLNTFDSTSFAALSDLRKMVETYSEEYLRLGGEAARELQNAEYALEDARIARDSAYDALYTAQENNNRSAATVGVELQSIAEEIRLQQEKIKSLAGDESNTVLADVPGTVSTVDCTAGDTVLKNALLCTLEVPDMGYTLSFAVTNDQAQRLRVGDTATVSNYYWGSSVVATLTTIRTDPKNPQGGKILVFDLTGDVAAGSELTISVGQKSANYDLVVPNSAVKSDSNGSFVLAVAVKSSPLGNRYTARRVSVEVKANDDNNSAVVADLTNGDFVITTSSAPIKSGDMVRLADSD